jgi:hypothetical protein
MKKVHQALKIIVILIVLCDYEGAVDHEDAPEGGMFLFTSFETSP